MMRKLCLLLVLLLSGVAACTITPESEPLPEGVTDPKEDLVEHLKDNPNDVDSHADLLRLQINDGDIEGARTTVGHAIKHNGGDYRAHLLAAQYHRWQADLISAEKSLLAARDLAPEKLEPRVALSGLYNQTYLESEELEQRRIAYELADPGYRSEFLLDYAFACAQLGRDDKAAELAAELIALENAPDDTLSRGHVLLCEIALRDLRENDAVASILKAWEYRPEHEGIVQYAARLVTTVVDAGALRPVFETTLDTQDKAELRWAALFGHWMLDIKDAAENETDPLGEEVDEWWRRLDAVSPQHPDTLARRYQLMVLNGAMEEEAAAIEDKLEEMGFGATPVPSSLRATIRLWRAEDALRLGAPNIALDEIDQLEVREAELDGLRIMRTMALFRARQDERALGSIDSWLDDLENGDPMLQTMRWWILLRRGESRRVLNEIENRDTDPNNATLWIEAVAKFHIYRQGATEPEEG